MKSKSTVYSIIVFSVLLLIVFGISYAYFTAEVSGEESASTIAVTGGTLTVIYSSNDIITAQNVTPDWSDTKDFTITGTNTTDLVMSYQIQLDITENTFEDDAITYSLTGENESSNGTLIPTKHDVEIKKGSSLITIGTGTFTTSDKYKHIYHLTISFPKTDYDQNANQNKKIYGHIILGEGASVKSISKVTGTSNVALSASAGTNLLNYQIYGNSIQNGTPTPTSPVPVESLGEHSNISILSGGKNYFDRTTALENSCIQWANGRSMTENGSIASDYIFLKAGSYVMNYNAQVFEYDLNKNFTEYYNNSQNGRKTFTLSKPMYIRLGFRTIYNSLNMNTINDIQLEEGNSFTFYEPYETPTINQINLNGHDPLRCVGEASNLICDYIDFESGSIIRNVGSKVLNGTESYWYNFIGYNSTNRSNLSFQLSVSEAASNSNTIVFSDKIKYKSGAWQPTNNESYTFAYSGSSIYMKIPLTEVNQNITDDYWSKSSNEWNTEEPVPTFKAWLSRNPIIIYYKINTKTEPINLPDIPTTNNTTIINAYDEEMNASKISVSYGKKE